MSSLLKLLSLRQLARSKPAVIHNVARKYADYRLEELVPSPYPKTKKEREAAAKKYGLLPQEYEPCPDDGFGHGDYPNLPEIGGDARGPHYPWDYPEHRKDFNDPWHVYEEQMQTDRYDPNEKLPYPLWLMYLIQIGFIGGLVAFYFYCENYQIGPPVLYKQYPVRGVTHYTFEPALD